MEGSGGAVKRIGDVPVPVCALSSCGAQPLIAVGLCHGTVHIVFVKQVNRRYAKLPLSVEECSSTGRFEL